MNLWSSIFYIWYLHTGQIAVHNMFCSLIEEWRKRLDNNFVVGAVLAVYQKLLIDAAGSFNCKTCSIWPQWGSVDVYSILPFKFKQCARINNTYGEFENIITDVPQGSVPSPLLFNISINDLLFFMSIASVHHFADDNALSAFADNVSKLINI